MKMITKIAFAATASIAFAVPAKADEIRPGVDANGDGLVNVEEFVMAHAQFDMDRFDENDDDIMSLAEFNKPGTKWRENLIKQFNADGNDHLDVNEMVEMYVSIFTNRDKDQSGSLTIDELPGHMVRRG